MSESKCPFHVTAAAGGASACGWCCCGGWVITPLVPRMRRAHTSASVTELR